MLERDRFVANECLVRFLTDVTEILELQLVGICNSINVALSNVMMSVTEIANQTEFGKKQAEEVLESTYFSPDQETNDLMSSIQDSVDSILDGAARNGMDELLHDDAMQKQRRLLGQFSKHMEALSTLDGDLQKFMLIIIGALSNEDVISQRLEHVSRSLNALKLGLSYVLVDIDNRFTFDGIRKLKFDLLSYTLRQYTTEDEKQLHEKWFKVS